MRPRCDLLKWKDKSRMNKDEGRSPEEHKSCGHLWYCRSVCVGPCFGWSWEQCCHPTPPPTDTHTPPTSLKNVPCQQVDGCVIGRTQRHLCLSAARLQEFRFFFAQFHFQAISCCLGSLWLPAVVTSSVSPPLMSYFAYLSYLSSAGAPSSHQSARMSLVSDWIKEEEQPKVSLSSFYVASLLQAHIVIGQVTGSQRTFVVWGLPHVWFE